MAQNRDRNWQDRDQQQGGSMGRGGGWPGGEELGASEQGQQHGFEESQGRGSWSAGQDSFGGGWGGGAQQGGEWNRMGRYNEEGWHAGSQGGGTGHFGQGGNYRMDRDFGQSGGRYGSSGLSGGWEGQGMNRPHDGEQRQGGARGGYGGGHGTGYGIGDQVGRSFGSGYGASPSYGSPRYGENPGGGYGQQGQRGFWERAGDEVSSWFGDEDARRRRDMDEHRGRGPKGYTRSDERIREDVNDRLTDDGWLDASDIEVQVASSEVTLSGQVASRAEKRRAEDIADAVSGVKHVQNNLRVKDRGAGDSQGTTTQFGSSTGTAASQGSGTAGSGSRSSG